MPGGSFRSDAATELERRHAELMDTERVTYAPDLGLMKPPPDDADPELYRNPLGALDEAIDKLHSELTGLLVDRAVARHEAEHFPPSTALVPLLETPRGQRYLAAVHGLTKVGEIVHALAACDRWWAERGEPMSGALVYGF